MNRNRSRILSALVRLCWPRIIAEVRLDKVRELEVSVREVHLVEIRPGEVRPAEVGAGQEEVCGGAV
jgi:hypothetical protein